MEKYIQLVEQKLKENLSYEGQSEQKLIDAMRYSLSLPGKRVRPVLTLKFCELCGGKAETALPFACAVEIIHTFSLIHDDLPCMDNDDFRRGQPSNHKVFGEAMALLAGDALQSRAFEIMLSPESVAAAGAENTVKAAYILAKKSGMFGMAGGQAIDLESEGKRAGIEVLRELDEKKTANMIEAACMMGCVAAGADEHLVNAAERYAHDIGLAFQIVDDILDLTSTTEELGKPVGSDLENEKSTYVSVLGVDGCKKLVDELTENAVRALDAFDGDTAFLKDFAFRLAARKK